MNMWELKEVVGCQEFTFKAVRGLTVVIEKKP
jgi:hypothetical protein